MAATLAIAFVGLSRPNSYPPGNNHYTDASIQDDRTGYLWVIVGWASSYHDALEALAGVVSVAFTGILTYSTIGLWKETRRLATGAEDQLGTLQNSVAQAGRAADAAAKSASVAERALTELERPYVVIDMGKTHGIERIVQPPIPMGDEPAASFPVRLLYRLVNHGRTPAIMREFHMEYRLLLRDARPIPVDPLRTRGFALPGGLVIPAGKHRTQNYTVMEDIWPSTSSQHMEKFERFLECKDLLYLLGYASYYDVFGYAHISGFCVVLDDNAWLIAGGQEYNYTKPDNRPAVQPWNGKPA